VGGIRNAKAKFIGYMSDGVEHFALYNVIKSDNAGMIGSTVSGETLLHDLHIPIPFTPVYKTWKFFVESGRRCEKCFWPLEGRYPRCIHHPAEKVA
jgi:hypothetical protein